MIIGKKIIKYQEIDSTNDEAKRLIAAGEGEGCVVIAESQTKGRGKPGSGWFSPRGGVYLSAIVKPFKNPKDLASITLIGAQAVVSAIKKISGLQAEIKKPNDVLINGRKVCGILVERLTSGEIIIGVGININNKADSFPQELEKSVTSLRIETDKDFKLQEFIDLLLTELDQQYLAYLS